MTYNVHNPEYVTYNVSRARFGKKPLYPTEGEGLKDECAPKKTDFARIKIRLFGGSPRLWARSPRHGERRPRKELLLRASASRGRRADEQPDSLYHELALLRGRSGCPALLRIGEKLSIFTLCKRAGQTRRANVIR